MDEKKLAELKKKFLEDLDQVGHDFLRARVVYVDQDEETGLCALYPIGGLK